MSISDLNTSKRGLPPYFSQKLDTVISESTHVRKDLVEAEASRYRDAALLAERVHFHLIDLLQLGQKSPEEQLRLVPELSRSSHSGGLHSATFLSAIAYCCHENEEGALAADFSALLSKMPQKLPLYFTKRLHIASEEEKESLYLLFKEATEVVEKSNFQMAAVLDKQKHDLYSEVALLALRYACYVEEAPGSRRKRFFTSSRIVF